MDENINVETKGQGAEPKQPDTHEPDAQAALATALADAKRYKSSFDRVSSELAAVKKQLNERLTADEKLSIEKAQEEAEHKQYVSGLERFKAVTELADQFVELGYSKDLARKAAEAQFDGDRDEVLRIQKDFQTELEKKIKAELMRNMPAPSVGNDEEIQMTKEQFNNLSYTEQVKLKREHPAVYDRLSR